MNRQMHWIQRTLTRWLRALSSTSILQATVLQCAYFFDCSIINERKNHSNFQLLIITHDENFLQKLGQSEVMEYYWSVFIVRSTAVQSITLFPQGEYPGIRGRSLRLK